MIIEIEIRNYLLTKLNVPILTEQPTGRQNEYVVFQVTDRGLQNHIESATVEFYCYAESQQEAAELDAELRQAMLDFIEVPYISASKFGGGRNDKDDTLKRYRYRSYFNLFY